MMSVLCRIPRWGRRSLVAIAVVVSAVLSACSGAPSASAPPVSVEPMNGAPVSGASSGQSGSRALTRENVDAWLEGYVPAALESRKVAGATVAIVKDGQVLTSRGFGYADTGHGGGEKKLVDENTLFRVGSISKIPTSIAVMQLVEQGKVDLDADISTYVDVPIHRRFDTPITVRHLLTHTTGIENHGGKAQGTESFDLEKHVMVDPPEQIFEPGTTPAYSNYGMNLAGLIVQKVSGQRFEDYVKTHIFDPLGMDSSTYDQPLPEGLRSRMSQGYKDSSQTGYPFEMVSQPSGSWTTSGKDFAAFMNAQLAKDPRILKAETWEQMWSAAPNDKLGGMHKGDRVGLGYILGQRHGHQTVGHSGAVRAFHSRYELYPEQGIAVFISVNSDGISTSPVQDDLVRRFAEQFLPDQTPTSALSLEERTAHAREVAGIYEQSLISYSNFFILLRSMEVFSLRASDSGNLIMEVVGNRVEFEEIEPYVWYEVGGNSRISADVTSGQVRLNQLGVITYLPQPGHWVVFIPILMISVILLVGVALLWVVGGIRAHVAHRCGAKSQTPLPWQGRLARVGGILAALMPLVWMGTFIAITSLHSNGGLNDGWIRAVQGLQLLAVAAIIPAIWDLVTAVRSKRDWPRVTISALLVLGLVAMAYCAILGNTLNPDISY